MFQRAAKRSGETLHKLAEVMLKEITYTTEKRFNIEQLILIVFDGYIVGILGVFYFHTYNRLIRQNDS